MLGMSKHTACVTPARHAHAFNPLYSILSVSGNVTLCCDGLWLSSPNASLVERSNRSKLRYDFPISRFRNSSVTSLGHGDESIWVVGSSVL